jgi:hypothetical protein
MPARLDLCWRHYQQQWMAGSMRFGQWCETHGQATGPSEFFIAIALFLPFASVAAKHILD